MFYVYFNKENRNILSISNEKSPSDNPFVEKNKADVIDFLSGEKNIASYKLDSNFQFEEINKVSHSFDIDSVMHKLKRRDDQDFTVIHDTCWKFKKKERASGRMTFAVTLKDNPNLLVRTFSVHCDNIQDIEFISTEEMQKDHIDVWLLHKTIESVGLVI